jgi:hypothetical protein
MKDIKLIALDFDGVLNNAGKGAEMSNRNYNLHASKIEKLNRVIDKTTSEDCPTKILLSSTWRHEFAWHVGINMFFEAVGIRDVCIGKTEHFQSRPRGLEILEWIIRHQIIFDINVKHLCILDDDRDMSILSPWLVNTSNAMGLTDTDVIFAIEMLGLPFRLDLKLGDEKWASKN